jgi:phage shock protein E
MTPAAWKKTGRRSAALRVVGLTVAMALSVAACSSSEASGSQPSPAVENAGPNPGVEAATAALEAGATVIDVRTLEEYTAGYIEGAELIDIQGADFSQRIGDLDPAVTYVVYCRSGNRSAAAAERMRAQGLDVLDGGALGDMVEAGWSANG